MTQLSLFPPPPPPPKPAYPWLRTWPEWFPRVGGLASIHEVILDGHGYAYMDPVRITAIEGDTVRCTVECQHDPTFWKNGTEYTCTLQQLWPLVGWERNDPESYNGGAPCS